ncbi:MAG: DUF86 domain-containing protein [Desulfobacterales bacterium]|jgi:uncharacterized protein YutE (UPF0331/DUF86 family)|nr:DUF86 domain-containing protein [Desulfobacterales bacterium]
MVDETLILRKLSELEEYLRQIQEFKYISISQYRKDWKIQRIIERTLQMMIETCADIASHIISDKKYRIPNSYVETFEVLYDNKLINKNLFETMKKMAKFRNVVVHHYDNVDAEIVVAILKKNLTDFTTYKTAIIQALKNS